MTTHLVIPDLQIRPGSCLAPLKWAAMYAADKRPDVIIQIGDWADMQSLGTWERKKMAAEGRRVRKDLDAVDLSLKIFHSYLPKDYRPRLVFTEGNHEGRIHRYVQESPELDGVIELPFERYGWEVYPFLQPVTIDTITYCHYYCRSANGRVMQSKHGMPNARTQAQREMRSCTAGHQQSLDYALVQLNDYRIHAIIAGSYHPLQHEEYLTPQGAKPWHGLILKHGIENGEYSPVFPSADYLCRRYEGVSLREFARDATDLEKMVASV